MPLEDCYKASWKTANCSAYASGKTVNCSAYAIARLAFAFAIVPVIAQYLSAIIYVSVKNNITCFYN